MDVRIVIDKFGGEKQMSRRAAIANAILLVYGIFLLIFPASALNLSVGLIGVALIVAGIISGVFFFLHREEGNYPLLVIAGVGLVLGILVMFFRANIALVLFPLLLGLWTLCTALLAAIAAYGYYKTGNGLWWIPLLAALVALVVTGMVFANLSGTERFMARILGIYFITYNLIRLSEYGATRAFPASPASAAGRGHRARADKGVDAEAETYEENAYNDGDQYVDYQSYSDYDDDAGYREYRARNYGDDDRY